MSSKEDTEVAGILAGFEVEDRAVALFSKLTSPLGNLIAVKIALLLADAWKVEAKEMTRRNDPRLVYLSTNDERSWLHKASEKYSVDPMWQDPRISELQVLFEGIPADAAAFVAYKVARYVCRDETFP
jgi:hypothetical protein